MSTRGRRTTRLAAAFLLLSLVGVVGACSEGGGDASSGEAPVAGAPLDGFAGGRAAGEDGAGEDGAEVPPTGANRTVVQAKAVIKTGQVALTSDELGKVRQQIDEVLVGVGGSIDREESSHDRDGAIERSTLVLRVPVARFKDAIDALERLGRVRSSDTASKNVTTEVIDVDERVETLQASLDRLQRFQRQAADVDDLIRFEDQITERAAELTSLQAQQDYLADQTSMSTITVYLSTPERFVPPPDALADAGFLTGLRNGWNALKDFVVVTLTVTGAVLPFAVTAALVGVPVWLLLRRRATPVPTPPPAD